MSLQTVMQALMGQIEDELTGIPDLQVATNGLLIWNPTPPTIDVTPADPFQEQQAFGTVNDTVYLLVRARVNTPDNEAAQELLLSMLDPNSATSVQAAIHSDRTLGGAVSDAYVSEGPSNYGVFPDPSQTTAGFLGCTWTVMVCL